MSQTVTGHIPVQRWLDSISLQQYEPLFRRYHGTETFLDISEKELIQLGIQNGDHRTRIIASLRLLAQKYQQISVARAESERQRKKVDLPLWKRRELQAELEAEFRLPPTNIASYAWFHGTIPRPEAEKLVTKNGDFLIRESVSQPGSYVLTCNHKGTALHFMLNRFETSFGKAKSVEYGFEGSRYTSVPALIMAHVCDGKIITTASQAVIINPVNRLLPLSQCEQYRKLQNKQSIDYASTFDLSGRQVVNSAAQRQDSRSSLNRSAAGSKSSLSRNQSNSQTSLGMNGSRLSLSQEQLKNARNTSNTSLERVVSTPHLADSPTKDSSYKIDSSLQLPLSPNRAHSEGDLLNSPTSKPQRSVQFHSKASNQPTVAIRNKELYDAGADYSDYDEVKRAPTAPIKPSNGDIKPPVRFNGKGTSPLSSLNRRGNTSTPNLHKPARTKLNTPQSKGKLQIIPQSNIHASLPDLDTGGQDYDVPAAEAVDIQQFTEPVIPVQYLDATGFQSDVITPFNKPLDPLCMFKMKEALFQAQYKFMAKHITYLDTHLLKVTETRNLGAGIFSGIEALTLPQGHHFRDAAIERHYSLAYTVAVTILACTDDLVERSQMLKQWLNIATELLRSHGNMFSFVAVIQGLLLPSITRLSMTWNILQRREPVLSNLWKTRLRVTYRELNMAGSNLPMDDNVCIPHILPICEILERDEMMSLSWEETDPEYGLDILLAHMDLARMIAGQTRSYSAKSKRVLQGFLPQADLRDLAKVELHMRLLYGHKGAQAKRADRQQKFGQILDILSKRAEGNDLGTEL